MQKIRLGVIGMGNIGKFHAGYLLDGKISRAELTAVASASPDKLENYKTRGVGKEIEPVDRRIAGREKSRQNGGGRFCRFVSEIISSRSVFGARLYPQDQPQRAVVR